MMNKVHIEDLIQAAQAADERYFSTPTPMCPPRCMSIPRTFSLPRPVSTPRTESTPRLITIEGVIHYTGLSSTTIYNMLNKKSNRYDSTFPIQFKLSKRRVVWVESEIVDWLNDKIAARFK